MHSYEVSTTTIAIRKIEVQDPKAPLYDVFKDFSLVEPRIDKVLTQYRESEKLLSMYRVYLRQIEIVAQVLENIAQVFNIERAVGHQLTLLGRRMDGRENRRCAHVNRSLGLQVEKQPPHRSPVSVNRFRRGHIAERPEHETIR